MQRALEEVEKYKAQLQEVKVQVGGGRGGGIREGRRESAAGELGDYSAGMRVGIYLTRARTPTHIHTPTWKSTNPPAGSYVRVASC